jgi:HSP20 family protein
VPSARVAGRRVRYTERRREEVRISDLIPWRKKNRTRVPVRVEKRPVRVGERDVPGPSDDLFRWCGLAPFGAFGGWADVFGPRMDMLEDSEAFRVTIEVPGMDEDDIDVALSADRLTIRGEKREERERRGRSTYRLQRSREAFRRSVILPCQIDADQVEATLRRGVLTISLPKAEGMRGRRRIPVRRR